MTPAVIHARRAKKKFTLHPYTHDPSCDAYGREAVEKLELSPDRVFKTLVVDLGQKGLGCCLVSVDKKLDLKAAARLFKAKKVKMAHPGVVERSTGYVLGGVSPLGQKKKLPALLDRSALNFETIFVSAGKRGLEIELSPRDLTELIRATHGLISR